jgi:hypothetical protein
LSPYDLATTGRVEIGSLYFITYLYDKVSGACDARDRDGGRIVNFSTSVVGTKLET